MTDPFTLSDCLFVKNFRLTKNFVKELMYLCLTYVISNLVT
jgi:hypothetical protein